MKNLSRNSIQTIQRPVKVLQFGEGNFLRAFADWVIDILNEKTDFNGNIKIVQPLANGMIDALQKQDCLYHVILNGIQHGKVSSETRLITSVTGAINPYNDFNYFLSLAENPSLQFVISNTTESGIAFDETDTNPKNLAKSFPAKVTQLLYHRFEFFKKSTDKGLIFLPCELIEKNGTNLKAAINKYINLWNLPSDFKEWLDNQNTFCNTLVDRIVPGFPKETISTIQQEIGFNDNLIVMAEPFHLWVIEGPDFVKELFPTEKAGLQIKFVKDLTPYRTRKVRILNGAHTGLVPVAYLRGLRTVKESVEDAVVGQFITKTIHEEIVPTLDLPADELNQFASDVMERFQNPFIKHELISIALNSISKFKVRVLPSLLAYHKQKGTLPKRLVYSLAALIRFYKGETQGELISLNDSPEILSFFKEVWTLNDLAKTTQAVLSNRSLWDLDLTTIDGLETQVISYLKEIDSPDSIPS